MIKIIIQIWMLDLHRNKAKLEKKMLNLHRNKAKKKIWNVILHRNKAKLENFKSQFAPQ